jgi:hypothetical protein
LIVTTAFGVAVPEMVGESVAVPLVAGVVMATVGGAMADTLTGTLVEPPGPLAVTVRTDGPVGTVTEQVKVPDALAVTVHRFGLPGPAMTTVLPGVAVPEMGCVVGPVGGVATVRLGGPTAVKLLTAGLLVPPALVATAVIEAGPSGNVIAVVE